MQQQQQQQQQPRTRRCRCGTLIEFHPTASSGSLIPMESDSRHTTWRPGDWSIGDDGRARRGAPMFDEVFIRPHWYGCPDADRYREVSDGE